MSLLTVNSTVPRALLIPEILSNVISHVGTHVMDKHYRGSDRRGGPTPSSRRTLFALALTCRAFSEQALDALWETSTDIVPLLRCAGIIVPPQDEDEDNGFISPTESQLAIISRYAHRVRFLSMTWLGENPKRPSYALSFLQTLVDSSKILMPNLRCLVVETGFFLHLVPPLLGPRLQHLTIRTLYYGYNGAHVVQRLAFDMILRSLPSSCPSLQSFKVDIFGLNTLDASSIAPLLSHAIPNLPQLRTVIAPVITKDALTHLPSSLTSIETHLPTGSDLEDILGSSHGHFVFRNLGSVDWWIKEWRDVEDFARLWPGKLTSLSLRSSPVRLDRSNMIKFNPGQLQVLFDSLHTSEAFKYLQCIRLSDSSNYSRQSKFTKIITIDTLRPLFHLTHLKVVDMDTTSSISLYEEDLKEAAKAWPRLEVLLLNKKFGWHAPTPMTLVDVVKFIELCPCLTELCVGITLEDVDDEFGAGNLHRLKPCDSDTLEHLTLRYPHADDHCFRIVYGTPFGEGYGSPFNLLLKKLFPGVKPVCNLFGEF
ncbi:hypothetical protein DFH29DRAFT_997926 [Suillus ampliporus]|nr:hypothetical protein DFH29DRAFT_997926 [Suillus ampliporus]